MASYWLAQVAAEVTSAVHAKPHLGVVLPRVAPLAVTEKPSMLTLLSGSDGHGLATGDEVIVLHTDQWLTQFTEVPRQQRQLGRMAPQRVPGSNPRLPRLPMWKKLNLPDWNGCVLVGLQRSSENKNTW